MLTSKEKRIKEKEMRSDDTWDYRVTQDMLKGQLAFSACLNKKEQAWRTFTQGMKRCPAAPPRRTPLADQTDWQ